MDHSYADEHTRYLQRYLDPRLSVQPFKHTTEDRGVWWIVYNAGIGPIRLFPLDAIDPERGGARPSGDWLHEAMNALNWRHLLHQAKQAFSMREQAYRKQLLLNGAAAA